MRNVLAKSLARDVEELSERLHKLWLWPSPDTGFAAYALSVAGKELPFTSDALVFSHSQIARFDEAPVLAAGGYALSIGSIKENEGLHKPWAEGLNRLSVRDPFPGDRNSFFFRPTELLGICLGAAACSYTEVRTAEWLRSLLVEKSLVPDAMGWASLLALCAMAATSNSLPSCVPPTLERMGTDELSLLRWVLTTHETIANALNLEKLRTEIDRILLQACLERPPMANDAASAAVTIIALKEAIADSLQSSLEENWQIGRERPDAVTLIRTLCSRFPSFVNRLQVRHDGRPSFTISDEYDVQDLLHALLSLHFSDIRPEEWTPSYGGKASRTDFLLKSEKIVIETKMTRDGLDQKKIRDELIIDKESYRVHPDCKTLICFVYDPDLRCSNSVALENDLSQNDPLNVVVIVEPKYSSMPSRSVRSV